MTKTTHIPVMLPEVMTMLQPRKNGRVLDCTLGLGGHAAKIAKAIGPEGRLIGIDRDEDSLSIAQENMGECAGRCTFVHKDFRDLDLVLRDLGIKAVDTILFDLGVSSYQLESAERGFSFQAAGPLDMRMDRKSFISAYDLINSLSSREISLILRNFGEERFHDRIAHILVKERVKHPIESTEELKDIILKAIPHRLQHDKIHPATRSFQAFRIAVNRELEALEIALDKGMDSLSQGGRMGVIAFHSLEDRIVKHAFLRFSKDGKGRVITKKPLAPTEAEARSNPRSRSARFRVIEKI